MLILGIETSCDETAAAVVRNGKEQLSSVVSSQVPIHRTFGGVVPEIASRCHLELLPEVAAEALRKASIGYEDLDGVAVTAGPGLIGSLLVGLSFAKGLSLRCGIPLIGIHHLEAHIQAVKLEHPDISYPAVALVASGGHTGLYYLPDDRQITGIGKTRDDAAGEAFDKVARLLGLGYPGGPPVEEWAVHGDEHAISFPIPKMSDGSLDFSFSGIKTATMRYIREEGIHPVSEGEPPGSRSDIADITASFQRCAVDYLVQQTMTASAKHAVVSVLASGGVLCNSKLRQQLMHQGERAGYAVYCSSQNLSTDNAVMIASLGFEKIREGIHHGLDLAASASLAMSG